MKTRKTRLLAILFALVLIVGVMASCDKTTEEEATKAPVETKATEKATEEPAGPWTGTISVSSYAFGPLDEEEDFVGPYIEEALLAYDIDVDLEYVYIEYPNYNEIINTRLAGGTAPDIFLSQNIDTMLEYYDQGAIASWTKEFYLENAPNLNAYIEGGGLNGKQADSVDLFWEYSMVGEEMVTISGFSPGGNMPYKNVVYRADWLETLGVTDLPTTVDGFVDLMYRFANEDPNGSGKKDTFGMSSSMIRALFGAYGNYNGFIGDSPDWYEVDGKLMIADIMPENKDVLEILVKMYADGVLHPEFITRENEGGYWALSHHMINGQIGVSCLASIDHYRYADVTGDPGACLKEYLAINGADSNVVYGPWPAGPDGEFGYKIGFGTGIGENAVYNASLNDDTEKLAAIFKILDVFATDTELGKMAQFGKEGETYEVTGPADKPAVNFLMPNEELNALGVMAYRSLTGANSPYNPEIFSMSFANNPTVDNRLVLMEQPQYASYRANELYVALPSSSDYKEELKTYRDETWINIITGELSIDYWDTFVEEYMALGGEVLTAEANE